jgi:hypothetical protein
MLDRTRRSLAVLAATAAWSVSPASADPVLKPGGKTLDQWIEQARGKNENRAKDAWRALARARFLVGAHEKVVPFAAQVLDVPDHRDEWHAVACFEDFGPLAASHGDVLRRIASAWNGDDLDKKWRAQRVAVALVLTGADIWRGMTLLAEQRHDAGESYKLNTFGNDPILGTLVSQSRIRLRHGEVVAEYAHVALNLPTGNPKREVLWAAERLGPAAEGLVPTLVASLEERDPVDRARAAVALCWMPSLSPNAEAALEKALRRNLWSGYTLQACRALAAVRHEPAPAFVEVLKAKAAGSDASLTAWGYAAIARLAPQTPRIVEILRTSLVHADPEARVGAADGLLALGAEAAPAMPDLRKALTDVDLRVRWRAAAALLPTSTDDVPRLVLEIGRGVDGPDDDERVAAFAAIARLGAVARPLAPRLEPWAKIGVPLLAEPAARALASVRKD